MPEASGPAIETLAIHGGAADGFAATAGGRRSLLEERLAALEGGSAAVAVASGPSASLLAFHVLCRPGDEIVAARRQSSATAAELGRAFASFGWRVVAAEASDVETFTAAISPRTKAILVESIGDSGGVVTDLEEVATVARRAGVPLIVDNTLATPALCQPFDFGADIVLHSTGEFLAGDASASGGAIIDGGVFDWSREGRYPVLCEPRPELAGATYCERYGNCAFAAAANATAATFHLAMPPPSACLTLAGIETAPLRMRRQSGSALEIAGWLAGRKEIGWVGYAGLPGHRHHNLARRYAPEGCGAVLTFGMGGGEAIARRVAAAAKLFGVGGGSRGRRSSIQLRKRDADDAALRLSVGLESPGDLLADLEQALAAG